MYTSINNQKIKNLKKLNQKKYRDKENLFLVEGRHLVEEAYKVGILKEIYSCNDESSNFDVPNYIVTEEIIKYLSEVESNQKIIGLCSKKEMEKIGNKVIMLDDIQDPGNLGTIIRSSVAFNFDTIILSNNSVDLYNPKVIRASQGMMFKLNIIRTDLIEKIKEMKKDNYKIIATKVTNGKDIKSLEKSKKICIIMGNEGNGVREEIMSLADDFVYIKMNENCESLNVAVATSILLYELGRD